MKHFQQILTFFLLLIFCQWSLAGSNQIPAQPIGYVNDYAHLLTAQQIAQLNSELHQFDQKTSNQIVVASFDSLHNQPLEDFSIHLAQAWKIGTKQHDNGVLLVIVKDTHEIRIEVGYGLEGVLTDAISSTIIRQDIAPNFKQGDFNQGIQKGVQSIMQVTQGEYQGITTPTESATNNTPFLFFILLFLIIHFIFAIFRYRQIRGTDKDHGWQTFLLLLLLSYGSRNRSGNSGNDNDFMGGGGGFGGGGASGKW